MVVRHGLTRDFFYKFDTVAGNLLYVRRNGVVDIPQTSFTAVRIPLVDGAGVVRLKSMDNSPWLVFYVSQTSTLILFKLTETSSVSTTVTINEEFKLAGIELLGDAVFAKSRNLEYARIQTTDNAQEGGKLMSIPFYFVTNFANSTCAFLAFVFDNAFLMRGDITWEDDRQQIKLGRHAPIFIENGPSVRGIAYDAHGDTLLLSICRDNRYMTVELKPDGTMRELQMKGQWMRSRFPFFVLPDEKLYEYFAPRGVAGELVPAYDPVVLPGKETEVWMRDIMAERAIFTRFAGDHVYLFHLDRCEFKALVPRSQQGRYFEGADEAQLKFLETHEGVKLRRLNEGVRRIKFF